MSGTVLAHRRTSGRVLEISLWIAQFLVALSFCAGGVMKMAMNLHQLAGIWSWTGDLNPTVVRLLGAIDFAGGMGVLLPGLTRIKPGLIVYAALGCVALQACAIVFHAWRDEFTALPVNAVLITLSAFMLWGRRTRRPISPS